MREHNTVTIPCTKVRETDAAIMVQDEEGDNVWFPWSQMVETHFDKNLKGHIVVTEWIAKQKGYE